MFKIDINSIYQKFWVSYDILKTSPESELHFDTKGATTLIFITNSNLSNSQIQFILIENLIEFEEI